MLISVIIAAYRSSAFITKAMDSVRRQTYPNIELIVCDDCSPDDTVEVVEAYIKEHPGSNIRLIRNDTNLHLAGTRNHGFAEARGEWVTFLDHDDWYADNRIERLVALAGEHPADFLFDNLIYVSPEQDIIAYGLDPEPVRTFPITAAQFVEHNMGRGFSYGYLKPFVRRSFLDQHGILHRPYRGIEDFVFAMDSLMAGARMVITTEPLYYFQQVPDSISRGVDPTRYERFREANRVLLGEAQAKGQADVVSALEARDVYLCKMVTYNQIRDLLRRRQYGAVLPLLAANARDLPYFAGVATKRLRRRLQPGGKPRTGGPVRSLASN